MDCSSWLAGYRLRANGITESGLATTVTDRRTWTADPDRGMTVTHGELLCRR